MAQAARLNLRMQKELKLLLSDPPPGASFPLLSADSSSLSTIHAQIEGPGGTVYANGVFNMTIQIPERYPFQPPCVTFATPIYHPNIDNGGRICLDILNLPPKGAWQPSLNISTVLTSIGLLLSEPNPDDGLMCEASREYKYNRQAFDQKARSLTEKYAKPGANGNFGVCQVSEKSSSPSKMKTEGSGNELKHEVNECFPSHKKQCGIGRKLSLESSSSTEKRDANSRGNEIPNEFENQMEAKGANNCCEQLLDQDKDVEGMNLKRRYRIGQGPLLESSDKCKTSVSNNENMPAFPQSSGFPSLSHLEVSHVAMLMPQAVENSRLQPPMNVIESTTNDSIKMDYKKLCSVGKKLSLGSLCSPRITENRNKENVMPVSKPSNRGGVNFHKTESAKFHEVGQEELLEPLREVQSKPLPLSQDSKCHDRTENVIESTEQSAILDAIIVLDSEDSEEESNALSRSRLLVARRRMAGKRKARV